MFYAKTVFFFCFILLMGCAGVMDDLNPSATDERPFIEDGSIGPYVKQIAPDFTVSDTLDNIVTLSADLANKEAIVLYFTMWCPVCDSHMSHMRTAIIPNFPSVQFFMVDYVTGEIDYSRSSQLANGYSDFTVLVDENQSILNQYKATMGTTVVIDRNGVIAMNEDYKDGSRLREVLESLP